MIGGVSFQPGSEGQGSGQPKSSQSVQEAIQVLSLRLPKTVGARAIAPGALLNAQGSGGNPRIDSVVNQVLSRMFPTGDTGGASAPIVGVGSPNTSGTMPVSPPVRYDGNVRPNAQWSPQAPEAPRPRTGTPGITFNAPGGGGVWEPGGSWSPPPPAPPPPGADDFIGRWPGPLPGADTPPPQPMSLEQMFGGYDSEPAPPQETYSI